MKMTVQLWKINKWLSWLGILFVVEVSMEEVEYFAGPEGWDTAVGWKVQTPAKARAEYIQDQRVREFALGGPSPWRSKATEAPQEETK